MAGSLVECKSPQQTFYRGIVTMDYSHSTTSSPVRGKHLSYEDRALIQIRLKNNYSIRAIAREIGCSPNTVSNEITRGSVTLYNGHVTRYKASAGQKAYEDNRKHSCRHYDFLSKSAFLNYVLKHFTAVLILASLASRTIIFPKSGSGSPRNIDLASARKSRDAALRNVQGR